MHRLAKSLSILALIASSSALADDAIQVVVETEILAPDDKPGMKSRQVIRIDFANQSSIDTFETGSTDFDFSEFGLGQLSLDSIRNKFEVGAITFTAGGEATFKVSGATASGVAVLPDIDYGFDLSVKRDGSASLTGCHDAYPAYRVIVEGKTIYEFRHEPTGKAGVVKKLAGVCDVRVDL